MHITFYGGVREVTGSMHMLTAGSDRVLLDCGMFQGRRKESAEKNRTMPFDPRILTNIVLSHAHIDHSGRIPLVVKKNFNGRIICTRVTAAACEYLLTDAGHIQESDAQYLNYKTVRSLLHQMKTSPKTHKISTVQINRIKKMLKKNGRRPDTGVINELMSKYNLNGVSPLYTIKDAERALGYFDGYPYQHPITIGQNMTCTFYDAGHILGSAITLIKVTENGRQLTIGYTGDIGRFDKPILEDPTLTFGDEPPKVDLLIMESTYGNRFHDPVGDIAGQLKKVIRETVARGGSIIIPAFAYGRTQELIYVLHELYNQNEVPRIPIYIDSPLATKITRVFGEHPEAYDQETHQAFLKKGQNPFSFDQIQFVASVEESMALMRSDKPHIVISASGMCEAGRILHHLRCKIHNPKHTILIVGFMAQHTLGRRILELSSKQQEDTNNKNAPVVKIFNKTYPVRAQVVQMGGFSAHADRDELLRFLKKSNLDIKKIAVVHGEEEQSLSFKDVLEKENFDAFVPHAGETVQI
jgi:metallo-beta-lactamase family protein